MVKQFTCDNSGHKPQQAFVIDLNLLEEDKINFAYSSLEIWNNIMLCLNWGQLEHLNILFKNAKQW